MAKTAKQQERKRQYHIATETHLAGFERKRRRSLLLMDHGCLGICLRLEKMFAMLQQPAARAIRGEY